MRGNLDLNKAFDGLLLLNEPVAEAWGVDHREPGSVPRVAHPVPDFSIYSLTDLDLRDEGFSDGLNVTPTQHRRRFLS